MNDISKFLFYISIMENPILATACMSEVPSPEHEKGEKVKSYCIYLSPQEVIVYYINRIVHVIIKCCQPKHEGTNLGLLTNSTLNIV